MVVEDREVLVKVWEGRIPCLVHLAPEDGGEPGNPPPPCCIMLPRQTYLPLASEKVRKHFATHLKMTEDSSDIWFSFHELTLRWHYPVGLLYDLVTKFSNAPSEPALPWNITAHFSKFPQEELLPCSTRDHISSLYLSQLKEADQLKHHGKVVSGMQAKDHTQLFLGLASHKFEQFWAINRKLMGDSVEEGCDQGNTLRHLPIKLHTGLYQLRQKLITPFTHTEAETGDSKKAKLLEDLYTEFNIPNDCTFLIQGISPSPNTPLLWLCQHLAHPDNFLHVLVIGQKS